MAGDGGLREALSTVQPTDLGPVLHSDHPLTGSSGLLSFRPSFPA